MFSIIQGGWNFRKEGGVDENDMRNNSRGCVRSVDGFPAALESLPVPNENKAYGELYGRIVERIHLWPGLAPRETESSPGRFAYDEKIKGWRRWEVSQPELTLFN